ncbi:MAG TPA: adenylate/guanylate cyclase domain-containing protein, partial [Geminicoccaceae bacterium]|nr:adenylate/guanylate cyclase domain-containing protein [Geminicoccaceae bacterium]
MGTGDLGSWLRGLGLAKYQALFDENEIDLGVLPELDEADLEKLGIPMGPRKKLLRAIAELPASTGPPASPPAADEASPLPSVPPYSADRILRSRAASEGERRQVTVLFADVVGSTDLVRHLGAERASDLFHGAIGTMADAVHRFEGTVNKVEGDGLMAIFGAPFALEDHATRACQAALAMQRALGGAGVAPAAGADRDDLAGVRVRIGLHSGEVVVRAVNNDLSINYDAIGLTVHLAARMEQTAPPGRIRLTAETRRLASGYIETDAVGPIAVKGLSEPIEVFELTGTTGARGRLDAAAGRGLTRFVGRAAELALLEDRLARARDGQGQVVFIVGEPGIGKSRLLHEFRGRVGEAAVWLEGRTLSFGRNMAFHPVRDLLQRAIGIDDDDRPALIAEKVERHVLRVDGALAPCVPYIRHLLGVGPGDEAVSSMDPQLRRAETFAALRRLLLRAAERKPQVVVVEDLHWADTATEEFLTTIADDAPAGRILFLFTYRPGYANPFGERTFHTRLVLTPLPADAAVEMAGTLLGAADLGEAVRVLVVGKAEGNPFFVEEIAGSLRELGALRRGADGRLVVEAAGPDLLPGTIQDVIMARIDRLPEAPRTTLQLASVIGREFTRRLIDRLDEIRDRTEESLRELKAIELIHEKSLFPELAYMFKHALTQDVAYRSLLERRRRELHRLVGEAIEILYAERLAEQYDVLAYHFSKGEDWSRALHYFRLAAEKAGKALATREALALYDQALEAADHLGDAVDPRTLIAIHEDRANLFGIVSDFRRAQEEAEAWLELARKIGDREGEGTAQVTIGVMSVQAHDFARALDRAERAIEIAEQIRSDRLLAQGH